jgi:hypothetical protein
MSPRSRPRSALPQGAPARRALAALAGLLIGGMLTAGCSASFDPSGPCRADGSAVHAYPELEAQLPTAFRGTAPSEVDSGRACTPEGLGTLAGHGIGELRFAGATWSTGTDSGVSLATFRSEGTTALTRDWLAEFYETGARGGKNVESVDTSEYQVEPSIVARRIDVLNGESFQSVVVWDRGGRIETAVVADFIREIQTRDAHDKVVREAVDAWRNLDSVPK